MCGSHCRASVLSYSYCYTAHLDLNMILKNISQIAKVYFDESSVKSFQKLQCLKMATPTTTTTTTLLSEAITSHFGGMHSAETYVKLKVLDCTSSRCQYLRMTKLRYAQCWNFCEVKALGLHRLSVSIPQNDQTAVCTVLELL